MIITEDYTINDTPFVKTYSDKGMMIEREGEQYAEANDPAEFGRKYTETDIPIDGEVMSDVEEKAKAYDILMGVSE